MHVPSVARKVLCLVTALLMMTACEENNDDGAPLQPVATLPAEFVDSHGGTWLCDQPEHDTNITGTVALENPPELLQNTDILHLTLFEQDDSDRLRAISSHCINNIDRQPIAFNLSYDQAQIRNQASYGISANYFELIGGNMYEATHKRNGLKPVISNGITEQVDIVLPAANP